MLDNTAKTMQGLMEDVDASEIFGLSLVSISIYTASLLSKSPEKRTVNDNAMVSTMNLVMETLTLLAKQNKRIQALQSNLSQLTKRVRDMERCNNSKG